MEEGCRMVKDNSVGRVTIKNRASGVRVSLLWVKKLDYLPVPSVSSFQKIRGWFKGESVRHPMNIACECAQESYGTIAVK